MKLENIEAWYISKFLDVELCDKILKLCKSKILKKNYSLKLKLSQINSEWVHATKVFETDVLKKMVQDKSSRKDEWECSNGGNAPVMDETNFEGSCIEFEKLFGRSLNEVIEDYKSDIHFQYYHAFWDWRYESELSSLIEEKLKEYFLNNLGHKIGNDTIDSRLGLIEGRIHWFPPYSRLDNHQDGGPAKYSFSICLNSQEEGKGGELVMEDKKSFKSIQGDLIVMSAGIFHSVNKVEDWNRFSFVGFVP